MKNDRNLTLVLTQPVSSQRLTTAKKNTIWLKNIPISVVQCEKYVVIRILTFLVFIVCLFKCELDLLTQADFYILRKSGD
jgi:hypothetical protein